MPIRFRCRHCNQLLGIARRKAGTPVQCPTCQQQVLVPPVDEVGSALEGSALPPAAPPAPLFERSEFEAYLKVAGEKPATPPAARGPALAPMPPVAEAVPAPINVERLGPPDSAPSSSPGASP